MAEEGLSWLLSIRAREQRLLENVHSAGCFTSIFATQVRSSLDTSLAKLVDLKQTSDQAENRVKELPAESAELTEDIKRYLRENGVSLGGSSSAAANTNNAAASSTSNQAIHEAEEEEERSLVCLVYKEELDEVPKYLKNRLTLDEVNEVVRGISRVLENKILLLRKPFMKLANRDKDLVNKWKEQGCDQRTVSCTEVEVKEQISDRHKKNIKAVLPILRHLRRITEKREKGISFISSTSVF